MDRFHAILAALHLIRDHLVVREGDVARLRRHALGDIAQHHLRLHQPLLHQGFRILEDLDLSVVQAFAVLGHLLLQPIHAVDQGLQAAMHLRAESADHLRVLRSLPLLCSRCPLLVGRLGPSALPKLLLQGLPGQFQNFTEKNGLELLIV